MTIVFAVLRSSWRVDRLVSGIEPGE